MKASANARANAESWCSAKHRRGRWRSTIIASTTSVTAFIKSGWRDFSESMASQGTASTTGVMIPSKWAGLFNFFKSIGLEIGQNFIKITNFVSDNIIAKKVQTDELCLEDVCVNKTQLAALLAGGSASSPSSTSTPVVIPPTPTSTDPIIETPQEPVATSTEPIITEGEIEGVTSPDVGEVEGEAPDEVLQPEPTPEPVPEPVATN